MGWATHRNILRGLCEIHRRSNSRRNLSVGVTVIDRPSDRRLAVPSLARWNGFCSLESFPHGSPPVHPCFISRRSYRNSLLQTGAWAAQMTAQGVASLAVAPPCICID
ncbi:unnamed protein product [Victoria cruziana]